MAIYLCNQLIMLYVCDNAYTNDGSILLDNSTSNRDKLVIETKFLDVASLDGDNSKVKSAFANSPKYLFLYLLQLHKWIVFPLISAHVMGICYQFGLF